MEAKGSLAHIRTLRLRRYSYLHQTVVKLKANGQLKYSLSQQSNDYISLVLAFSQIVNSSGSAAKFPI